MSMTTANLAAVLTAPKALSAADVARLKREWERCYTGKGHRVAILTEPRASTRRYDPYFWQAPPLVIRSATELLMQATVIGGTATALLALLF